MEKDLGFGPTLPSLRSFVLYRKVHEVARIVHCLDLAGDLREQMVRAATSVVLNVAEGSGQPSVAQRRRYWGIARGSVREVAAAADLAAIRLGDRADLSRLAGLLVEADRILGKLTR